MRNVLKSEIKRAFRTPGFGLSLILGNSICILYWILEVCPLAQMLNEYMNYDYALKYPTSMFEHWIGMDSTQYAYAYFLLVPILAALPFGAFFFSDTAGGYINFVCSRCDRKKYLRAKYIAVSLSAGCACIIPLIINIMLTMLVLPCVRPEPATYGALIQPKTSFSFIFYNYPWIYIVIALVIIFLYAAVIAGVALAVTFYSKNKVMVIMSPLLLSIFIMSISVFTHYSSMQPVYFIHPGYPEPRVISFAVETIIIFLITWFLYYVCGREEDIC